MSWCRDFGLNDDVFRCPAGKPPSGKMRDRTPRRAGTNRCGPERSGDTDVSGTSGRVDKLWIICRLLSGTIRIRLEQSGSPMSITGLVFAAGCGLRGKYTAADTPLSRVLRSFSKKNGNPLPNAGKIGYLCLPEPAAPPGLRTGPSGHRSGGPDRFGEPGQTSNESLI